MTIPDKPIFAWRDLTTAEFTAAVLAEITCHPGESAYAIADFLRARRPDLGLLAVGRTRTAAIRLRDAGLITGIPIPAGCTWRGTKTTWYPAGTDCTDD